MATVTALWLCALPSALAQSEDWLVLPTTVEDEATWMQPTVRTISRELRRQGIGVWLPERAVSAFDQRGSASPGVVSESRIEGWEARSQQALRTLASGDYATALAELEQAQAFSRNWIETLNRDPSRARGVLDVCLFLVRALYQSGDVEGAALQAEECVRMAPSGAATWQMHPPVVVELYETVARPGPARTSTLLVESEPPECALRLNGVRVGRTPFEVTGLYAGRYRVQVECDPTEPGPVHAVEVPRGSTSLFVFDRFDRSVRTRPVLHLQYDELPALRRLVRDARELARTLPAAAVVLASVVGAQDQLEIRVVRGTQIEPSLVRITTAPAGPSAEAVSEATTALLAGECRDFTGTAPLDIDCRTGEPVVAAAVGPEVKLKKIKRARPPRGQFVSGLTLASAGTASLLTGYGLLIARRSAGEDWITGLNSLSAQDSWLGIGTGLIVTGSVGGGLLVAAMPLVLPFERKTPWWAWVSGGLGLAAAAGSIVSGVTAAPKPPDSCATSGPDPTPCVNHGRDVDRAVLLGATAAPLLTMPLVYLLRRDEKRLKADLAPSVIISRHAGAIVVRGVF